MSALWTLWARVTAIITRAKRPKLLMSTVRATMMPVRKLKPLTAAWSSVETRAWPAWPDARARRRAMPSTAPSAPTNRCTRAEPSIRSPP